MGAAAGALARTSGAGEEGWAFFAADAPERAAVALPRWGSERWPGLRRTTALAGGLGFAVTRGAAGSGAAVGAGVREKRRCKRDFFWAGAFVADGANVELAWATAGVTKTSRSTTMV
jgi:hypothetical protein